MKNKQYIQQTLIAITLICSLGACENCLFKKTTTGLQYRVVHKCDGPRPQNGEIMFLDMLYKTEGGETVFNSAEQDIPIAVQYCDSVYQKDGGLKEAISMLQKGDSTIFKLSAKALLGHGFEQIAAQHKLAENSTLFLHLSVKNIMSEKAFRMWEEKQHNIMQEKAKQQLQKDVEAIDSYLQENKITAHATTSGLRYVIDKPGQGPSLKPGNTVKVNYTGQTLDGQIFDTSLAEVAENHGLYSPARTYEPIVLQLGSSQVIQGWEEGIKLLRKGAKARLFIPSTLAYGSHAVGDSIKPNTILIFDVELVDVSL